MSTSEVILFCADRAELVACVLEMANAIDVLFDEIKHGDDEHKEWLRLKIDAHFTKDYADLVNKLKAEKDAV